MGERDKSRNERVKERREFLRAEFFNACADNGLRGFLEERAYGHAGCYYQYTGVSALCGMINSGVIHLSRARELNDLNEIERPHVEMWDCVYIASFSYRKRESMAMWGLYCDPFADAVRLHFPLPALRLIVKNAGVNGAIPLEWNKKEEKWHEIGRALPVKSARMTDVVYKTKNTLQWKSYSFPLSKNEYLRNTIRNGELLGQIKNSAWNYENEVRLIVELAETVKVSDCPKRIAVPYGELLKGLGVLCEMLKRDDKYGRGIAAVNGAGFEGLEPGDTFDRLDALLKWSIEKLDQLNPRQIFLVESQPERLSRRMSSRGRLSAAIRRSSSRSGN